MKQWKKFKKDVRGGGCKKDVRSGGCKKDVGGRVYKKDIGGGAVARKMLEAGLQERC